MELRAIALAAQMLAKEGGEISGEAGADALAMLFGASVRLSDMVQQLMHKDEQARNLFYRVPVLARVR